MTQMWLVVPKLRISQAERTGLRRMACAIEDFEPYPQFIIDPPILQALIEQGLVERGPSDRPGVDAQGFRLTRSGCDLLMRIWRADRPDPSDPESRASLGEVALAG